jgi:hemoglobin
MEPLHETWTVENNIKLLVGTFTLKCRKTILLIYFRRKIGNRWPEHLENVSILANYFARRTHLFRKSFPPHKQLAVNKEHFDRWMEIFTKLPIVYLQVH